MDRHESARPVQLTSALPALNYRAGGVAIGAVVISAMSPLERAMSVNVTVTERAAQRIGEILRQEPAGTMLRVSVEGGGCSGFQYKFDTERETADDDVVIERRGVTVPVDPV